MSDTKAPAGNTGGQPNTSKNGASTEALPELPAKVRVHALAKLLGKSSREVLDALTALGEPPRSAQSSVDRERATRVASQFATPDTSAGEPDAAPGVAASATAEPEKPRGRRTAPSAIFLPPDPSAAPRPARASKQSEERAASTAAEDTVAGAAEEVASDDRDDGEDADGAARRRRRRGRRGRGRGKGGLFDSHGDAETAAQQGKGKPEQAPDTLQGAAKTKQAASADTEGSDAEEDSDEDAADDSQSDGGSRRRRRRRRRKDTGGGEAGGADGDPPNTVVHVRAARDKAEQSATGSDEVRSVRGSTRLEAKRQRRRDGREAGRRRVPILSESEFLARRESVERKMVVRERDEHVQIGVLEDGVLCEHFVTSHGSASLVGNVYLGRVQNVLPSMEAAFVDIGRGRNAVLYAGEVDWDSAGLEGKARKIEQALSSGDSVLVQVTKDPVGHKGARLTTQISLPGRFLVYVPGGGATGISRKLPDTERKRLKDILKRVVPSDAGVIVRTASEGIGEQELDRDVQRLQAQWEVIKTKSKEKSTKAPELLYEEPDLLVKVVRDLFTEDFAALIVQGGDAWDVIDGYVRHVAPDLSDRLIRHVGKNDVFTEYRIDEQITKALDRKVWLPSGGTLVIDRTEAMTVIDVNTGKFTGSGGNLEETVTKNNLESAEEIVRQLRLRDIGGIIVIDFIDMVLESNRDLVLRRLTECLGRDRTRHQVAEVTSLGLVQMTRKRVGTALLDAFSTPCEHCRGRGVVVSTDPIAAQSSGGSQSSNGSRKSRNRGKGSEASPAAAPEPQKAEDADPAKAAERIAALSLIHAKAEQAKQGDLPAGGDREGEAAPEPASVEVTREVTEQAAPAATEPAPREAEESASNVAAAVPEASAPVTQEAAEPTNGRVTTTGGGEAMPGVARVARAEPVPGEEPTPAAGVVGDGVVAPRRRRRAASRPSGPPAAAQLPPPV